jgi:hypothetical protein
MTTNQRQTSPGRRPGPSRRQRNRVLTIVVAAAAITTDVAVPTAAAVVPLKAVVTLTPVTSTLGRAVTAAVSRSTMPAGDSLRKIGLNWGDGSKAITLASLRSRPSHRYGRPGAFTVRLTLVDRHGNVAHASAVDHVTTPAASYHGLLNNGLHFFVSFGHTRVQDLADFLQLNCSNGTVLDDTLIVPTAAIRTDGSFAGSHTDTGILNGQSATYADHVSGRFSWSSTAGVHAAGTMRETIAFPDSGVTCTTNTVAWTAERDIQPAQHKTAPPAGSYHGLLNNGLHFFVSFGHTRIQDGADFVQLNCSNGTVLDDTLIVPTAAIRTDGSFAGSRADTGILNGQSANFSYAFRGNFHSVAGDGAFRAAGTMRESIALPDSGVTCTTNTVAWSAERDIQPAQHNTAPPTGTYTGLSPHAGLAFTVASSTSVQNVSEFLQLNCSNGTALDDTLIVPTAAITTTGAFAGSNTDTGILGGHPTEFTYTFRGNFHSTGPDGAERAAGTMRESLTFTDTGVTCTTNTLAWAAHRPG